MAQPETQVQPTGTSSAVQTVQQVQPQTPPAQTTAQPQPEKKKSKWWIWVIVVVVALIILGTGAYFLFFR